MKAIAVSWPGPFEMLIYAAVAIGIVAVVIVVRRK
jgi:hypothetical protein